MTSIITGDRPKPIDDPESGYWEGFATGFLICAILVLVSLLYIFITY